MVQKFLLCCLGLAINALFLIYVLFLGRRRLFTYLQGRCRTPVWTGRVWFWKCGWVTSANYRMLQSGQKVTKKSSWNKWRFPPMDFFLLDTFVRPILKLVSKVMIGLVRIGDNALLLLFLFWGTYVSCRITCSFMPSSL